MDSKTGLDRFKVLYIFISVTLLMILSVSIITFPRGIPLPGSGISGKNWSSRRKTTIRSQRVFSLLRSGEDPFIVSHSEVCSCFKIAVKKHQQQKKFSFDFLNSPSGRLPVLPHPCIKACSSTRVIILNFLIFLLFQIEVDVPEMWPYQLRSDVLKLSWGHWMERNSVVSVTPHEAKVGIYSGCLGLDFDNFYSARPCWKGYAKIVLTLCNPTEWGS